MASTAQVAATQTFALHDGERVAFYGDSITAQRLYTRLLEQSIVSRYPKLHVEFYNAANSGDTVHGGNAGNVTERVRRDVMPLKPTVITVSLGTNDGSRETVGIDRAAAERLFLQYKSGYRELLSLLQSASPGVRLVLTSPTTYDDLTRSPAAPGYNDVMVQYGDFVRGLAEERHLPFADFNHALRKVLVAELKVDPVVAQELLPDHIHPSVWGHWPLAAEMLRIWGFDPLVSSIAIDAEDARVDFAAKAEVTQLQKTAAGLSWTELEACLPLPLDVGNPLTQVLLRNSDLAQLDQEMLRVGRLSEGSYSLWIDGKPVGSFESKQLEHGVNLALYETPMQVQAYSIDWDGAERRAKLSATRASLLIQKPAVTARDEAVKALDVLDARMLEREYAHAQPVRHTFDLKKE